MKVYPNFETEVHLIRRDSFNAYRVEYETLIRVKGEDGVWYLFPFRHKMTVDCSSSKMFDAISRLNSSAYLAQQFTIINEDTKKQFPELVEDTNQQDERKRLLPLS